MNGWLSVLAGVLIACISNIVIYGFYKLALLMNAGLFIQYSILAIMVVSDLLIVAMVIDDIKDGL
ncbi:hypothetical protein FD03_GL000595 [Companilactobacillus nodensis DSM 19682 = JCM 14932 = NBRC 107160]|uniref:Uncharacterized protein n=1 Tax=Companilactobacillus nodensis DSM 19682 = JCM 14932 = NBRC 107160 TaxID=1423775 RepID=A0A0R1KF01_9LACO|nr:hypothetical protein [Companilactobacillus nodensis]KRK79465.1 hypothetical protein FD03_GL000595 [Companilactobacillus nodensis DSM 19682 = JCM 14932 = NBRC 107160]